MSFAELPADLPVPQDDGAAQHLLGMQLPPVTLPSTDGGSVSLSSLAGRACLVCYPMTGTPGTPLPTNWDGIPGARGCTPQACSLRDLHAELLDAGAGALYGISAQSTQAQREARERLHLPYELLSDEAGLLRGALQLPTFEVDGRTLLKRLTLVVQDASIVQVFYPIFPPNEHADDLLRWLQSAQAD